MKRQIPTGVAFAIIIFFSAIVFLICQKINLVNFENPKTNAAPAIPAAQGKQVSEAQCHNRAFEGEAKIKGWYVEEKVVQINDADISLLPINPDDSQQREKVSKIKIVDINPDLDEKISSASQDKPVDITIKGFAIPCSGVALASLEYKDGIFKPYLPNTN